MWDDRRRQKQRRPRLFCNLRLRELERFYAWRYGPTLPDDAAGRKHLYIAAQHIAQGGALERHLRAWSSFWAPWLGDDECAEMVARVIARPMRWKADTLAWRIGLTDADRTRLKITTIGATDCNKAARARRRKEQDAARHSRARRTIAARPTSAARTKPWEAAGMREQKRCGPPGHFVADMRAHAESSSSF